MLRKASDPISDRTGTDGQHKSTGVVFWLSTLYRKLEISKIPVLHALFHNHLCCFSSSYHSLYKTREWKRIPSLPDTTTPFLNLCSGWLDVWTVWITLFYANIQRQMKHKRKKNRSVVSEIFWLFNYLQNKIEIPLLWMNRLAETKLNSCLANF